MVDDLSPISPDVPDAGAPQDWVSAFETIRLVRTATLSPKSNVTILTRAHSGLIRTRADLLVFGDRSEADVEIPRGFWWAEGHEAIDQNWEVGDFETYMGRGFNIGAGLRAKAFGVRFCRVDLERMIRGAFTDQPVSPTNGGPKESGGRHMSALWPEWVAELVAYVHEKGFPAGEGHQGTETLIARVADGLAARDLEGPARSTVQDTVKAVLRRVRRAGNDT